MSDRPLESIKSVPPVETSNFFDGFDGFDGLAAVVVGLEVERSPGSMSDGG